MREFLFKTTIAAAKDATEGVLHRFTIFDLSTDGTAIDDDFSTDSSIFLFAHYLAHLTTAIDAALNPGIITADGQLGALDAAQLPPVNI